MFGVGHVWELVLLLGILVLLFGSKKIPDLARGLGQGMSEFRKATRPEDETTAKSVDAKVDAKAETKPETKAD